MAQPHNIELADKSQAAPGAEKIGGSAKGNQVAAATAEN